MMTWEVFVEFMCWLNSRPKYDEPGYDGMLSDPWNNADPGDTWSVNIDGDINEYSWNKFLETRT